MTPSPQQATVPLPDARRRAADLWDQYVAAGMSPEEATRRVIEETGVQPSAATEVAAEGAADAAREGAGLSGALRTAAQGATLGFADELEGLARGAAALLPGGQSPAEAYRAGVEAARADIERFREEHPVASLALEAGGGLALGGAGALRSGGAAAARSLLRRAVAAPIGRGAVEGAVAGAGAAEGGVGERVLGAAGGAALGAATGGLVQGAGALRGARGRAQSRLIRALEREGIEDPVAAVRSLAPGQTLMDIGETGGPLQRLARAAASIPSEGSERIRRTLRQRAEAAPTRITEALQRETRLSFEDAVQTVDDLMARRAQQAAPLYREAYRYDVSDEVVRGLFDDPEFQRAYRLAQRTAAQEVGARQALAAAGLPIPDDLADAELLPQLFRVTEEGKVEFLTKSIPVRALDYMKSALQEVIDQDIAGGRLTKRGAMMLKRKLDAFLSRVDELVPEYREARATFRGFSEAMDAFNMAREGNKELGVKAFLNEDPRRIEKLLREMSPSEQEFYRRGALDAVRARLERAADNRDLTRVLFGNTEMRRRIRTLFQSDEDFNRFRELMLRERRMAEGAQFILGGSPTARIQAEQADLLAETPANRLAQALDAILAPIEAGRRGVRALESRMVTGGGERTVDELAPWLTATGPEAGALAASTIDQWWDREALRRALLRAATTATAVPAGLAAGRAAAP